MLLTQILQPTSLIVPVKETKKTEVITELVDVLADNGLLKDRNVVLDSVLEREKTSSTGIGSGIAIPHGKSNGVENLAMSIGIAKEPINFEAIDGKPVSILVMLASPIGQTGPHIQALAKISRLMLDENFRQALINSESSEQAYELICKKESE